MEELLALLTRIDGRIEYLEQLGLRCESLLRVQSGMSDEGYEEMRHLAAEIVDELHNFTSQRKKGVQ